MEEECEKFLRDFTENPCLRKFGNALPKLHMSLCSTPTCHLEPVVAICSSYHWDDQ
jgi:hypothetical protein